MESLELSIQLINEKFNQHPQRLQHTLGVVEMASYLATMYHVDETKAKIAAYMHDYCKYDDTKEIEAYLSDEEKEECRKYPFLYHAYGSAYMYKKHIGKDEEIFQAIYNHVFGRPQMSLLESIIMIADYTEKNRKYENCIKCREILLSGRLNAAILFSLKKTIEFAISEGNEPHPKQLEVYREYLGKADKNMTLEEIILEALAKVKAENILAYNMKERSPFYDEMILCSVSSQRQATAAVSHIQEAAIQNGFQIRGIEGAETPWVLIDCNDVIVSIFTKEEREHFALEKIYMDIPVKKIEE